MTRVSIAAGVAALAIIFSSGISPGAKHPSSVVWGDEIRPADANDPLRLVSPQADLVLKIERPREIADLLVRLAAKPELVGFRGYRDYFASTNYQLFRQMVAHFEQALGHSWPELIDDVAGGGMALAIKFQPKQDAKNPAPAVAILQGKDPVLTERFFRNLREVIAEEQARNGGHEKYESQPYRGVTTYQLGENLYAAALHATLVYSNSAVALHAAIDQSLEPSKPSLLREKSLQDARALVPQDSLAWAWLSLAYSHQSQDLKPLFTLPSNFFPTHVLFGGLVDSLRRSAFVMAALHQESDGLDLSLCLPSGANGMNDLVHAHVPVPGDPPALPLLMANNAIYSSSVYLDLGAFWKQRATLLPKDQLKQIEEGDKKSSVVLQGTRFSQFLEYLGARHRAVVVPQRDTGYTFHPETKYPAFGLVLELSEPEKFESAIDVIIGGGSFLVALQTPLKTIDEKQGDVRIRGYRFVENDANKARNNGVLFNFAPCRARVGKMYVVASTPELARKLIDEVQAEAKSNVAESKTSAAGATIQQSRLAWSGISGYLNGTKEQLITRNMLEQGNTREAAAKEVAVMLELLDHLGRVELTNRYEPDQYKIDFRFLSN